MNSLPSRIAAVLLGVLFALTAYAPGVRAEAERMEEEQQETRYLVPVGHTVGVKLFAEGVLVVGLSDGETPAKESGLREGDILLTFNGTEVDSTEHLQRLLTENGASRATMGVRRGMKTLALPVTPETGEDGKVRLGAWIRDSMAGIGTMTFYDPQSGLFGALGHGVTDVDTGALMPLHSGSIMDATVKAVKHGASGSPGELRGSFDLTRDSGSLTANTSCGLFGTLTGESNAITTQRAVPVAKRGEIRTGRATILANVGGDEVCEYEVEIERVYSAASPTRNMLVRVTDPELLEKTGGIVQGMSGSPILQDGRLVGAVTHVLVNDAARGYGIFIENMLSAAEGKAG
ncbi:MAG: SpoIVB peptidase [Ruminococcaceae bacterium]|nr:SpoIVB peptidase [Oscillospiraceae bacterium]